MLQEKDFREVGRILHESCISAVEAVNRLRDAMNTVTHEKTVKEYNNRYAKKHHMKSKW